MDEQIDARTLNVVQQVLRGVVVALVAEHKGDMALTASLLQGFAAQDGIDPVAKTMLTDLAGGLDVLGAAGFKKS